MGHFTDFKLYWEVWGGYPDRSHPFGNPELLWVIASENSAVRCRVFPEAKGAMTIDWNVKWEKIALDVVGQIKNILEEIGAYDKLQPVVTNTVEGDYLMVWDITGVEGSRAFSISLKWTTPGEQWTPLGERFREIMSLLSRP